MTFHPVLTNAFCCIQIEKDLTFFKVDPKNPFSDSTQMKLEMFLAINEVKGNDVGINSGLFFYFDDACYFVNHTLITKMSFPKSLARKGEPPSAFISWSEFQLRWWVAPETPVSVSIQKLSAAVDVMTKHLQPGLLNHEVLVELKRSKRKAVIVDVMSSNSLNPVRGPEPVSIKYEDGQDTDESQTAAQAQSQAATMTMTRKRRCLDDCFESTLDSWTSMLVDCSRILKSSPTSEELCDSFLAIPTGPLDVLNAGGCRSSSINSVSSSSSSVSSSIGTRKEKSFEVTRRDISTKDSTSTRSGNRSSSHVEQKTGDYEKVVTDFQEGVFHRDDAEALEQFYDREQLQAENVLQECLCALYDSNHEVSRVGVCMCACACV
jgi:hypothetical protein